MLKQMAANAKRSVADWLKKIPQIDNTPIEAPIGMPSISSLADMRKLVLQINAEQAAAGNETFDEFWDFGEDEEDEFYNLPAPAQLRYDAIMEARAHDFDAEVAAAKDVARARLKAELRKELAAELAKDADSRRAKDLKRQVEEEG